MNAPLIWIFLPALAATLLYFLPSRRMRYILSASLTLILAALARWLLIDRITNLAGWQFKITPNLTLLGRHLTLQAHHQIILVWLYALLTLWLLGAWLSGEQHPHFPESALWLQALLLAALAIEPFVYAALFFALTALLTAWLFSTANTPPASGLLRYLSLQILALPLLLLSSWLFAGIESAPANTALTIQAGLMLGGGLFLLLPAFPFQIWLPNLADRVSPYLLAFWLFLFPVSISLFALAFAEHYVWLRESVFFNHGMRLFGLLTLFSGGLLAAYQPHPQRMLAYAAMSLNGLTLLAFSLPGILGVETSLLLIAPRAVSLLALGYSLNRLKAHCGGLTLRAVKGCARKQPFLSAAALGALFSLSGLPLFINFPIYRVIWRNLALTSASQAIFYGFGLLGLMVGSLRVLTVFLMPSTTSDWQFQISWREALWLTFLGALLILPTAFPQWTYPLLKALPQIFPHLGG